MNYQLQTSLARKETQNQFLSVMFGCGTTSITITNQGSEKEGVTHATIGQGNIEVADGSDISGINRDIDNANTITRDQITGALDGKLMLTGSWADTVWSSPNSALGLMWGIAGMPFGAEMHYDPEKGAIYFTNNPWGQGNSALTLGEVINYYNQANPNETILTYEKAAEVSQLLKNQDHVTIFPTEDDLTIFKEHENIHVDQSRELGPLYIPVYLGSGAWYKWNWMEKQADKGGNDAYKNSGRQDHDKPWVYQKK